MPNSGLVQFLAILLALSILLLFKSRFDTTKPVWLVIGAYLVSKILEAADKPVYAIGEIMSGHALKHVAAAFAALFLLKGMQRRRKSDA